MIETWWAPSMWGERMWSPLTSPGDPQPCGGCEVAAFDPHILERSWRHLAEGGAVGDWSRWASWLLSGGMPAQQPLVDEYRYDYVTFE